MVHTQPELTGRELGAIHNGQPPRVKTVRWERQKTFWKGERNIPVPDEEKTKETKAQSIITTAVSENTDCEWTPPLTIWILWDSIVLPGDTGCDLLCTDGRVAVPCFCLRYYDRGNVRPLLSFTKS